MTSLCSDLLRQCIKNVTRSDEKLLKIYGELVILTAQRRMLRQINNGELKTHSGRHSTAGVLTC